MAYVESVDLSASPCPIANSGTYVPRHDPFLFFQDVAGAPPSKSNGSCAAHHKLISTLNDDLAAGNVASYVFIVPDLCHDMHGSTACPSTDNVQMGDTWLSTAMPPLIDYVNAVGGVIFIVWDEESHVPFFAVGADRQARVLEPGSPDPPVADEDASRRCSDCPSCRRSRTPPTSATCSSRAPSGSG